MRRDRSGFLAGSRRDSPCVFDEQRDDAVFRLFEHTAPHDGGACRHARLRERRSPVPRGADSGAMSCGVVRHVLGWRARWQREALAGDRARTPPPQGVRLHRHAEEPDPLIRLACQAQGLRQRHASSSRPGTAFSRNYCVRVYGNPFARVNGVGPAGARLHLAGIHHPRRGRHDVACGTRRGAAARCRSRRRCGATPPPGNVRCCEWMPSPRFAWPHGGAGCVASVSRARRGAAPTPGRESNRRAAGTRRWAFAEPGAGVRRPRDCRSRRQV